MRSIFLEGLSSERVAQDALDFAFPDQPGSTKVIFDARQGDSIAYLYVSQPDDPDEQLGPALIQADYSGRSITINGTASVIAVLDRLQKCIGGELRNYGD